MATHIRKGTTVSWKSSGGESVGRVIKKITRDTSIEGHSVKASKDQPRYLVQSAKSGRQAIHKAQALTRV